MSDTSYIVSHQALAIKKVTTISTICDVFNEQPSMKKLLSEIHTLLKIYLTIPVTTATAERCFSALKRIKTYLQNSMTQECLNNCMILHVHKDKTGSLNLTEVAREVSDNDRMRHFFGNF